MSVSAPEQTLMFGEAQEAADVVAAQFARNRDTVVALAAQLRATPPPFVATCARGSSDHAATYGKYLFETQLGLPTVSMSPSVSSVYGVRQRLDGALYIAISQSGRSPDLLRSVEEGVESAAVAEGDRGEVDVDGADTVPQASLQGFAHQRRGFEVDLTGQGDQRLFALVMAVDGEL